jgi:hypothetical protein
MGPNCRSENESFEDFKLRKRSETITQNISKHGVLITPMGETNRSEIRKIKHRSIHYGSHSQYHK